MAPEVHGAQVLPDPNYSSKNAICPPKTGVPYNVCFIKFSPSQMVEAAEAGHTLFRTPMTRVWGCNPAMNLSCVEEYPHT